jgi:hypothetical protein
MSERSWIGVDLDGTLAHYDEWRGEEHIGEPIPAMLERVKTWLAKGQDVRIFTARVAGLKNAGRTTDAANDRYDARLAHNAIVTWCKRHIGREIQVTAVKDRFMEQLWDNQCVRVETNTGRML